MPRNKTISFSEKEWIYIEKLELIGIKTSQFMKLAFREKINRDYKIIEKEIEKLTKFQTPF